MKREISGKGYEGRTYGSQAQSSPLHVSVSHLMPYTRVIYTTYSRLPSGWSLVSRQAIAAVEEAKSARLFKERLPLLKDERVKVAKVVYRKFIDDNALGSETFLPPMAEVLRQQMFMSVFVRYDDIPVTPQDFKHVTSKLPGYILEWREKMAAELLQMVRIAHKTDRVARLIETEPEAEEDSEAEVEPDPTDRPIPTDQIHLAKYFFYCHDEGCSLTFHDDKIGPEFSVTTRGLSMRPHSTTWLTVSQLGSHEHTTPRPGERNPRNYEELLSPNHRSLGWDLRFDLGASRVVEKLVKAMGADPDTMTMEELERRNPRFYCRRCPEGYDLARSWRECVRTVRIVGRDSQANAVLGQGESLEDGRRAKGRHTMGLFISK